MTSKLLRIVVCAGIGLILADTITAQCPATLPPAPPTACDDPAPEFQVVQVRGKFCTCLNKGARVEHCFPESASFSGTVTAYYGTDSGDCPTICAVGDYGEVCSTLCQYTETHFFGLTVLESVDGSFGENRVCLDGGFTDSCCPERQFCDFNQLGCTAVRCKELDIQEGCLMCHCALVQEIPACKGLVPIPCHTHNAQVCCRQPEGVMFSFLQPLPCEIFGTDTLSASEDILRLAIFPGGIIETQFIGLGCDGDPAAALDCSDGLVTIDDDCCPTECFVDPAQDCNCDGFNQDTIIDWFVDIQKDNREKPNNVVKQFGWVRVGGAKRVFVRRKDRQPFCLSTISMSTFCIGHVAAKINFVDGSSTTVEMNVDDEQSDVSLGPFDPIYMDVKSVRIGFTKGGGTCFNGYVRNMKFTTCNEP